MSLLLASPAAPFASVFASPASDKSKTSPTQFMKSTPSLAIKASPISLLKCSKSDSITEVITDTEVRRSDFPNDFLFGASSSAIQTEGDKGRGACTWDMMLMGQNAIDSYHRYKEDVALLKNMSADCYRFSIAWSRIIPSGGLIAGSVSKGINQDGIDFYNNFINELIMNNIEPIVTLFHYDVPKALENNYGGFVDRKIIDDFKDFAEICFKNFGNRVKYWTTFNEPQVISESMYQDHYTVTHNIILAHATVAKLYRENFQDSQGGEIGFPLVVQWYVSYTDKPCDIDAAKRGFDFLVGAFLEPMVTGDYPYIMRVNLGDKLPTFSDDEKKMVKGSIDFITINYYTSRYARLPTKIDEEEKPNDQARDKYNEDQRVTLSAMSKDGDPIGPLPVGDSFAFTCPEQLRDALIHLKNHYQCPKIIISENGIMEPRDDTLPLTEALEDTHRIKYIQDHLKYVVEAMREGVNVKGYCVWNLVDSMELGSGYNIRMGLNYTDYLDNLNRIPKASAKWYKNFITSKS